MKEINICGIPHRIVHKEDVFDNLEKHFGLIDYEKGIIYINGNLPESLQKETIFHEYVHGVLLHIGEEEKSLDEKFVQTLSNALYWTFGDVLDEVMGKEEKPAKEDIVHCGECAHFIDGFCDVHSAYPTESDFCSWGEKK